MQKKKGKSPALKIPHGFRWAGVASGVKKSGKKDLALAVSDHAAQAVGFFTKHLTPGSPILVAQKHIVDHPKGKAQAILINSGNANVFTGKAGRKDSEKLCQETQKLMGLGSTALVLPASTGIIGEFLAMEKISQALPALTQQLGRSEKNIIAFAEGIATTDRFIKLASVAKASAALRVLAVAKGAGMLAPNMMGDSSSSGATMICTLFSSSTRYACLSRSAHKRALKKALALSLHNLSIDADMSTSDMTVALCLGVPTASERIPESELTAAYAHVLCDIGRQLLADGEGSTKVMHVLIHGAPAEAFAKKVAHAVSSSILVKTALYGSDPNWGRILMAIGQDPLRRWPPPMDKTRRQSWEELIRLRFHPTPLKEHILATALPAQAHTRVIHGKKKHSSTITISSGRLPGKEEKKTLHSFFQKKEIYLEIDFQAGPYQKVIAMNDLSEAYVRFNSAYSS